MNCFKYFSTTKETKGTKSHFSACRDFIVREHNIYNYLHRLCIWTSAVSHEEISFSINQEFKSMYVQLTQENIWISLCHMILTQ